MPRGAHASGGGTIRGNNRDNVLTGTNADEFVFGRGGDDVIDTGGGNDVATGGSGADTFVIGPGTGVLTITDFENGVDRIDVSAFGIDANDPWGGQYGGYLADLNGDTYLTFYDLTTGQEVAEVILQNVDYTLIDISDYIF